MPSKAMIQYLDSVSPNSRPLSLTPLAWEDLNDEPFYDLTPSGRAEIDLEQRVTLTAGLQAHLDKFTAARIAREKARGKELLPAMTAEEQAAIQLAWAIECAVNQGQ